MKRSVVIGIILAGALMVWAIPHISQPVLGQSASKEAPHVGEGGLPQFQADPNFPRLPAKWRMGAGSAVAIDDKDHVWILSRPRTLANPKSTAADATFTPAPPVMEFDNDGKFIQGWGGQSGPGYQWPSNEHGLTVDYKGFVWLMGNADGKSANPAGLPNDNQILKFTRDGQFVMAIGTSGQTGSNATEVLRGATNMYVYPKTNELFVADGYGNSRVMVYDADTGKLKRMWGAYGNAPLDVNARTPVAQGEEIATCPVMCANSVWSALQQFKTVHDARVSSDGLVYVADRGNKRVQVFTTNGQFVAEQFIGLDSKYYLGARGVAFSPDERFLYVAGDPVIWILNRRTLEVLGSFQIAAPGQEHGPGHLIAADRKGNTYAVQAEPTGPKNPVAGASKFVFKGYSPRVACPPCQSTRSVANAF